MDHVSVNVNIMKRLEICGQILRKTRIYGSGKTHTKLLTEFGQCCLRLRTCYRSFIINPGNFTSSQLTPDPKYTQEITRNFLKKFFCEKKKNPPSLLLFPCSLCVFLFWDDFSLHLTLSIYRRSLGSRWT